MRMVTPVAEPAAPIRSAAGLSLHVGWAAQREQCDCIREKVAVAPSFPAQSPPAFVAVKVQIGFFHRGLSRALPHGGELRHLDTDRLVCVSLLHSFGSHGLGMLLSPLGWGWRLLRRKAQVSEEVQNTPLPSLKGTILSAGKASWSQGNRGVCLAPVRGEVHGWVILSGGNGLTVHW